MSRQYTIRNPERLRAARRENGRARWAHTTTEERRKAMRPVIEARLRAEQQQHGGAAA